MAKIRYLKAECPICKIPSSIQLSAKPINSFNLTINLGKTGKLSEYYDSELRVLCHFKYPKLFIRRTKACYITFIKPEFLNEIAASQPATYSSLRKKIERNKMKLRFN
jgi:hypothetical protein